MTRLPLVHLLALATAGGLAGCANAVSDTDPEDTDVVDTDDTDDTDQAASPKVWINEILASNDTAESWEDEEEVAHFDDWVELYNPNAEAVDLSGWGLTDGFPGGDTPWAFPEGTGIAAGGYLVVWCSDGLEGPFLHTDFALSRGGETVTLVDEAERVVDEHTYPEQTTDIALYRAPDGGETWANGPGTQGSANPAQ